MPGSKPEFAESWRILLGEWILGRGRTKPGPAEARLADEIGDGGTARWWLGMELARARAEACADPGERTAAQPRAGDAYERGRGLLRRGRGEAPPPGPAERAWRAAGRLLAFLLGPLPELRRSLEDRLLAPLDPR